MVIFTIIVIFPEAGAQTYFQDLEITEDGDDGFVTEVGIGFHGDLVTILDPNMMIKAYLVFRELDINSWEPLNNATLRLYAVGNFPFESASQVVIGGIALKDFQGIGPGTDAQTMPFTVAQVVYNTSEFTGGKWVDINVTSIIQELISKPDWDGDGPTGIGTGDNVGFIIFGVDEHDTRYFYAYEAGNGVQAQLDIGWGEDPPAPPPGGGPPGIPEPEYNETYRDYDLWVTDWTPPNRTGRGATVNWNTLNMTALTEKDSSSDIFPINDTFTTVTSMQNAVFASLYNDTLSANVTEFFVRFVVNVTNVNNAIGGVTNGPTFAGMSTLTPDTGDGLAWSNAGEWLGLYCQMEVDDKRWRVGLRDADNFVGSGGGYSQWFSDTDEENLYFELMINQTGGYMVYSIYNDPEYTDLNHTADLPIVNADGPGRYTQVIASAGQAGASYMTLSYYTFSENPLAANYSWTVLDPNGTDVTCGLVTSYEEALECVERDLGGDPEDPDPPGQGWDTTGPFTRFNTRLYVILIGLVLIWGPVMYLGYKKGSGYEFVIGAFVVLVGFAFLIAAGAV